MKNWEVTERDRNSVEGWTERRGIRFMEVRAKLTGKFNDPAAQAILMASANLGADGSMRGIRGARASMIEDGVNEALALKVAEFL